MAFTFPPNFPFVQPFPFDTGMNSATFARAGGNGACTASAQAFSGPCSGMPAFGAGGPFGGAAAFGPQMVETPAAYLIFFDATGFKREDVKVKVTDRTLKLSAKKGTEVAVENAWNIPEDVQLDDIVAKYTKEELTVTLPRLPQEPKASFDVPIQAGSGAAHPASPAREPEPQVLQSSATPHGEDAADQDGSWVEIADEDVTRAKEKGKAPSDGNVLEDAER